MAINKNFVIKNGLEVNTNVLVAAAAESQVGVGTTRPYYKLHVGGGEGNRGGIGATDITITGIATIGVANSDSGAFRVLGISTFQGDLDLLGSAGVSTVRWDASKDALTFVDNASARFGTGEDLRIWHDGTNSYISDKGDGSLIIGGTDETLAVFTDDGSIQLYHNNTKVFETTGLGVTTYGDVVVSGVTTSARLLVTGVSTFTGAIDANGGANIAGGLVANSAAISDLTNNRVVIAGSSGEIEDDANFTYDGVGLNVGAGSGVTVSNTGNIAASGIVTASGGVKVGTAFTVDANTGNVAVSGILTVGGNLQVTGDITYDEVTGRNLNITGITTLADQVNFGTSGVGATVFANGNVAISGITTINGGIYVGTAASIHANGNLGVTGILTAKEFVGVFTSAGGAGVGIGSTTGLVGYGFTFINFKGPGVSTVFASSTTGIATIFFQGGGGGVGAAGTWTPEGSIGVSTSKSVGVNTSTLNDADLQGIGNTFQGLYIGNGMLVNDNALNGNHYIGTAFGGMMAGPVTINGVLTVDGNYVVV